MSHSPKFALLSTLLLTSVSLLTGCQSAGSPKPRLVEDKVGRLVRTLATTAESRVVVVKQEADAAGNITNAMILAEPSPDVAARLSSVLDLSAKAAAEVTGKGKGEAALEMVSKATRDIARLSARSQGVILFRDGAFQLSQAYVNGAVTREEFKQQLSEMFSKAAQAVEKELSLNPNLSSIPPEAPLDAPETAGLHGKTLSRLVAAYWSDEAAVKADFDAAANAVLGNPFLKAASGNPRTPTPAEAAAVLAKVRETAKGSGKDALRKALVAQFGPE